MGLSFINIDMNTYQITFTMKDGSTQTYNGVGQPSTDGKNTLVNTTEGLLVKIPKIDFVHFHII